MSTEEWLVTRLLSAFVGCAINTWIDNTLRWFVLSSVHLNLKKSNTARADGEKSTEGTNGFACKQNSVIIICYLYSMLKYSWC